MNSIGSSSRQPIQIGIASCARTETEINFWRPGVTSMQMARGVPWLFLIRGTNEIWGCGFFSAFSLMPIGVAWETFGPANGFGDFASFLKKIAKLKGAAENAVGSIGCAVLSSPEYFDTPIRTTISVACTGPSSRSTLGANWGHNYEPQWQRGSRGALNHPQSSAAA